MMHRRRIIDRATIAIDYEIMEDNAVVVVGVSPSPTLVVDDNNHDYGTTVINATQTHAPSNIINRATIATNYDIMDDNAVVVVAVSPSPSFVVDDNNYDDDTTIINVNVATTIKRYQGGDET